MQPEPLRTSPAPVIPLDLRPPLTPPPQQPATPKAQAEADVTIFVERLKNQLADEKDWQVARFLDKIEKLPTDKQEMFKEVLLDKIDTLEKTGIRKVKEVTPQKELYDTLMDLYHGVSRQLDQKWLNLHALPAGSAQTNTPLF